MDDWRIEQYQVHSRSKRFTHKVDEARDFIRAVLTDHPGAWAVNISGGKDSGVLADLGISAGWRGPFAYMTYAETPTANRRMVEETAKRYGMPLHVIPVPGAWDVYGEAGHFFVEAVTLAERMATARMLKNYKQVVTDYARQCRWDGQFLGLRAQESRPRRMMLSKKGRIYQTQDRVGWTACPLAWWTAEDIWAYTLSRALPFLPIYTQSDDPERTRSETTYLAAPSLWRHGFGAWLKRHQPDEWRRILEEFPDAKTWL